MLDTTKKDFNTNISIREYVPLAPYTTFGVGGPARYFIEAKTEEDVIAACRFAKEKNSELCVLGGGSNVLVSDDGFDGCILFNAIGRENPAFDVSQSGEEMHVRVGAGVSWDLFIAWCMANNATGLEALSGIPGTVGAAPVQNIGAYGMSVGEHVVSVETIDREISTLRIFSHDECAFGYRSSFFKSHAGRFIITHVVFRLVKKNGCSLPRYADLIRAFGENVHEVSPADLRKKIIEIRAEKGMVIMDGFDRFQSVGSFFKNPEIPIGRLDEISEKLASLHATCAEPWHWDGNETIKIAAACLMQTAGFPKGFLQGHVGISPRHALSIINRGDATAQEINNFSETIMQRVFDYFGITLEREVQLIGFHSQVEDSWVAYRA